MGGGGGKPPVRSYLVGASKNSDMILDDSGGIAWVFSNNTLAYPLPTLNSRLIVRGGSNPRFVDEETIGLMIGGGLRVLKD